MKGILYAAAVAAALAMSLPAVASAGPNVNVSINGILPPPPPGVHIYMEGERPYYIERDRRVYVSERPSRHKHWRKHKEHHDNGRGHAYGRHKGRD